MRICTGNDRYLRTGGDEGFDPPLQVLPGNDVHYLYGVRSEAEEHPVIDPQPDSRNAGECFEADDLHERSGFARRDSPERLHGLLRDLAGKPIDGVLKTRRKSDEPHGLHAELFGR